MKREIDKFGYTTTKSHWDNGCYYSPALREFIKEYGPELITKHAAQNLASDALKLNPKEPLGYPFSDYLELHYELSRKASYSDSVKEETITKIKASTEGIKARPSSDRYFIRRKPIGLNESAPDVYRMHLNVNGSSLLVDDLDRFCAKYKGSGCYYKTSESVEKWNGRHDPVVVYSITPWTAEQKKEIQSIVQGRVRAGADKQPIRGEELCSGVTLTDVEPAKLQTLTARAYALDANLGEEISNYMRNSAAEYYACAEAVNDFAKFLNNHTGIRTTRIDGRDKDRLSSFEVAYPCKIDTSKANDAVLDATEKYTETLNARAEESGSAHTVNDCAMLQLCAAAICLMELNKYYSRTRNADAKDLIDKYQEMREIAFEQAAGNARNFIPDPVAAAKTVNQHLGQCLSSYGKAKSSEIS